MDVIRKSWKYWKKIRPQLIIIVVFALMQIAISLIVPQITQLIIDRVITPVLDPEREMAAASSSPLKFLVAGFAPDDYTAMITVLLITLGAVVLLQFICHYTRWNMAHAYNRKIANYLRRDAFAKYLSCSPVVVHSYSGGDMMNILSNDIDNVMDLYQHRFVFLFSAIVSGVGTIVIMLATSPVMAIVPLALAVVTFFVSLKFKKELVKRYSDIREGNVDLNTCIQENINGVRIVRSFATEDE